MDTHNAREHILARLNGNRDYVSLLRAEMAAGSLTNEAFQARASRYVADYPGLINITWVGADFVVQDVAPHEPNKQIIGLHVDLPEPKRASRLALQTQQPAYTRPFEAIQGQPPFELWVPVFRAQQFLGLLTGVYAFDWGFTILAILTAGLALGMARAMWVARKDITERKQAEEALFEEKERAQVTLHSIRDAVITTDADGLVQ